MRQGPTRQPGARTAGDPAVAARHLALACSGADTVDAAAARAYAILAPAAVWRTTAGRRFPYEDRFMGERVRPLAEMRPTWVRWRIVALLMIFVALAQFNRYCISVAGAESIIQPGGISEEQMGWVYAAFLMPYTVFMTPGGWFIDRRGPRFVLLLLGVGSAVFVTLTGLVGLSLAPELPLLIGLFVVRGLLGTVNAPLHPGAARAVCSWLPSSQRALGNGLVNGAALAGIALHAPVFGWLIGELGWPWAFVLMGSVTALLAVVWAFGAADRPGDHPAVNPAERRLIESGDVEALTGDVSADGAGRAVPAWPRPTWRQVTRLFRNRSLVLVTCSYGAVGYFQYLFFYWAQRYFMQALHVSAERTRLYAFIPSLGMMVGMWVGGALSSWLQARLGYRLGRILLPAATILSGGVMLYLGTLKGDADLADACFTLAMAAVGMAEGAFWATAVELGGRCGGIAAGILNTGGNLGGLLGSVVSPVLARRMDWQGSFALGGAVAFVGAILWLFIDPAEQTGAHVNAVMHSDQPPA
jgi:ACS family glucarate transporter-like MFS transporter